jgi:hypothetical protein
MRGPKRDTAVSERQLDCEFDLEWSVHALVEKAHEAGWSHLEAAIAIAGVADNLILGKGANAVTDSQMFWANTRGRHARD